MKKTAILLFGLAMAIFKAQENKNYDWGKPETYTPAEKEKDLGTVVILDKTISEFIVEKNNVYTFFVHHTKTFVNSDEAIEKNNRVYVQLRNEGGEEVISQKVRVIKPNGTMVEMKDSDVMESVDEKTNTKMKYFALKGLEKNSVIEQILIAKFIPKFQGATVVLQDDELNKNVSYEIIYPKHLVFEIKNYNGLPNFSENKSAYKDKVSRKVEVAEIPALKNEEFSNFIANAEKFSYKLTGNDFTGKRDLFGYKQYTSEIFEVLDAKPDSKTDKAIDKIISQIPAGKDDAEKIRNTENFIKKNISFDENAEQSDILDAVNNKFTNTFGFLKLYHNIFNKMNINHQAILVSDRYKAPIDPKFELYRNLDEFAFYFPDTKGYLSPSEYDIRYPVLPYKWTSSYALFLKKTEFGGASIPDYDIKKIPTPGIDFTHDEMNISADFTKNSLKPEVSTEIVFNGYSALALQPYYDVIPAENVSLFEKDLAENYVGQKDDLTIVTENKGAESIPKPYIFKATFSANNLVEKVGDKMLFKVGQLIGRQTELYQKDKRQTPIEIQFPHAYERKITIKLPDGYTIKNPEQINSSFAVKKDGKEVCKFETTHEIKGNELVINNIEFYKEVYLPIELYDDYVKVINAAADFNKIVLVLQKK